jgi:hypothetical protein
MASLIDFREEARLQMQAAEQSGISPAHRRALMGLVRFYESLAESAPSRKRLNVRPAQELCSEVWPAG